MKKILLTGSGGFIGGHLKNKLGAQYDLFTPRSAELNLLHSSAVKHYVRANQIDFIIHAAAAGVRITADATMESVARPNIDMFHSLAETQLPMLVFGSGAEYDKSRRLHKVSENDFGKFIPSDPYGYSKYAISKLIEKREGIVNLRLFGVYGPGENPTRVTSYILRQIHRSESIRLNQNVLFDFIYIDDLCSVVQYFIKSFPKEKYINVTSGESIETVKLAQLANQVLAGKSPIEVKHPGMNLEYTASNDLLFSLIPGFSFCSYTEGLQRMNKYFKE